MHVYDLWRADGCSNLIVTKLVVSAMQICSWVDRTRMLLQRISCQRYVPQIASLQLKFCHSKLRAVFGFSKCAYNYYSKKKKSSRSNPKVGACVNRCEVTTPSIV